MNTKLFFVATSFLAVAGMGKLEAQKVQQKDFTPGNLLVVRVGDGQSGLTDKATAVFLDEYTKSGTLVQTVPMPTSGKGAHAPFVVSGNNASHAFSSLSGNGQLVTLMGYDAAPGTDAAIIKAASTPKVIAVVSKKGIETKIAEAVDIIDPRSAVTSNGKDFWFIGQKGGVRYIHAKSGTSTRITPDNPHAGRILNIYDGQLYVSTANSSGYLTKVGNGTPVMPTKVSPVVPYVPDIHFLVHGYVFFDVDPSVPGADLLYAVCDQGPGYLRKYVNDGARWMEAGPAASGPAFKNGALTGYLENGKVVLYTASTGKIIRITDNAGGPDKLDVKTEVVVTAASNTAFRGLTFTPESRPEMSKK